MEVYEDRRKSKEYDEKVFRGQEASLESSKDFFRGSRSYHRRLVGESDWEILMGPACVILSLGVRSSVSAPGRRAAWPALGVGV